MYPIANALITIGVVLVGLGIASALASFYKKEITEKIHDSERIHFSPRKDRTRRYNLIVPLRHRCKIHVQLDPTSGPFDFFVQDFVGFPSSLAGERWVSKVYYIARGLPRAGPVFFTLNLEPGNYNFVFHSEGHVEPQTTLTTIATYVVRPAEKLLNVGLQLLQVGMPVLITGLVLYIGLSSGL